MNAPEIWLGGLDPRVYQQDVEFLPLQQRGLRASAPGRSMIELARYQELCIRHHDSVLESYLKQPSS